ncbi:MAG: sensor histidine kinase, partial [Candidatus Rokuibacteriota bacterium]
LKAALPPELTEAGRADLLTMDAMGVLRGRIDRNTHELKGKEAGARSFIVSVLPIGSGPSGGARGAFVVIRDETDRIALADATARLAHLQDLVIRVLGHDVKTPIAVIQGYAELAGMRLKGALDEKGSEEVRRHMDHILEAVTTSQIILANARAISRLAAGPGAKVEFGALDITRMARQAVAVMQPLAHAKGVGISVEAGPNIFARAPKGFESVFMNLLSNGVKYTPPGGSVDLTLRLEDGWAIIRVADTGPGIDPDQRAKLFKRFERLDADQGKIEGQGLGLSIVASFVDLVGGRVRFEERKDGRPGSVFVVEMLASEANAPALATSSSQAGS